MDLDDGANIKNRTKKTPSALKRQDGARIKTSVLLLNVFMSYDEENYYKAWKCTQMFLSTDSRRIQQAGGFLALGECSRKCTDTAG